MTQRVHDDGPDALEMEVATSSKTNHFSVSCAYTGHVFYDSRFGGPPPPDYYRDR